MSRKGESSDALFRQAVQFHQRGELDRAEQFYARVLEAKRNHGGAVHYLGVIAYQRGDYLRAESLITRAIAIEPQDAAAHNNLGLALASQGKLNGAERAHERAIELRPGYADAWSNLGIVRKRLGRTGDALRCYEAAVSHQPIHVDALFNWGNALHDDGQSAAAVERYRQALALAPQRAEIHNNLGNSLLALRRVDEAVECYETALSLKPDYAEAHYNLGAGLAEKDCDEQAAEQFSRAVRLRPEKLLWRLRGELTWPPVFQSNDEIDQYRGRLAETIQRYRALDLRLDWNDAAACGCIPPFNMAHQGRVDLELKRQFAALFAPSFAEFNGRDRSSFGSRIRQNLAGRSGSGQILANSATRRAHHGVPRIGMVVTRGHEPIFLRCMSGIVNRLPARRFDMVIFCTSGAVARMQKEVQHADVSLAVLPEQFPAAVETLRQAACDVLYYWAVASDALNYFLPFLRLAPVQCTSWSTLVTSGVPQVDYYLSSALVETDEADAFYSERLVRLDSLLSCEPRVTLTQPARDREYFGLPAQSHLYVCPQNLMKFHPDFDELLAGILRRDPLGLVVIKHRPWPRAGELLQQRFRRAMPDVTGRVILLPWQSHDEYLQLLAAADVILDTPHYGAGSTTYDIFSLNQPLVTLPGRLNVSRYTLACYRKMGISELVADSPAAYLDLAVRVGCDHDFRHAVKKRIAERSELIFEDRAAVQEHVRYFENVTHDPISSSD